MMIAHWQIDARFGHKAEVIDSMKKWMKEIAPQIGWSEDRMRIMTGSIGETESAVISEVQIEDLAELSEAWKKLGEIEAHRRWSKELEPNVVSGSHRWKIYRTV